MPAPPKDKSAVPPARAARPDRTSAVVASTLVALALGGVGTIFWEPLTALALGTPPGDAVGETHAGAPGLAPTAAADGGAATTPSASVADASGNS